MNKSSNTHTRFKWQDRTMVLLFLLALVTTCLTSCGGISSFEVFDPQAEGLVAVETINEHGEDKEKGIYYYYIADNLRAMETDSILPDSAVIYEVPRGCIESYIDKQKNKVVNKLNKVAVTDEEGNPCQAPAIMDEIFPKIAALEHDLSCIRIFEISDEYFVYVEKNVNLWCPCCLYYYHQGSGKLIELFTFKCETIRRIQILSQDRLQGLR